MTRRWVLHVSAHIVAPVCSRRKPQGPHHNGHASMISTPKLSCRQHGVHLTSLYYASSSMHPKRRFSGTCLNSPRDALISTPGIIFAVPLATVATCCDSQDCDRLPRSKMWTTTPHRRKSRPVRWPDTRGKCCMAASHLCFSQDLRCPCQFLPSIVILRKWTGDRLQSQTLTALGATPGCTMQSFG